jgi:hypothetical protein
LDFQWGMSTWICVPLFRSSVVKKIERSQRERAE